MNDKYIEYVNQKVVFYFKYDPDLVFAVKNEFKNRKYDPTKKCWIVNAPFDQIESFATRYGFELKFDKNSLTFSSAERKENTIIVKSSNIKDLVPDARTMLRGCKYDNTFDSIIIPLEENDADAIMHFLTSHKINYNFILEETNKNYEIPENIKSKLLPFQINGTLSILKHKSSLVADEMGLGKTIQAIAAIETLKEYPVLIICPAMLKYNWLNEFEKFTNNKNIEIWKANKENKISDINIINYDIVEKFFDKFKDVKFKILVLDESHYVKNSSAKRTKAILKLSKKIPRKILLSGTPINNKPSELISQLNILNVLHVFNGKHEFEVKYCNAHFDNWHHWDTSGASNLDELHEKLLSIGMVRRLKKDVLTELPPKTVEKIILNLNTDQFKIYDNAEKNIIEYIKNEALKTEKELNIQGYAKMRVEKAKKAEYIVKFEALKQLVFKLKLLLIYEWIDNFLYQNINEKLIVFTTHKTSISMLNERYPGLIISGDVPMQERQNIIDKFQSDDLSHKILFLTLSAGKEGITLTKSSTLLFTELSWTPLEHLQAEDRIHRISQNRPVNIYYVITRNTIEEYIDSIITKKRKIMNNILDGTNNEEEIIDIIEEIVNHYVNKN